MKHETPKSKGSPSPPRFWRQLLRWLCHPAYLEDIEGDLEELYHEHVNSVGVKKARWMYVRDVIMLLRLSLIKPIRRLGYHSGKIYTSFIRMDIKNIYISRVVGILILPVGFPLAWYIWYRLSQLLFYVGINLPTGGLFVMVIVFFSPVIAFRLPGLFIKTRDTFLESVLGLILFYSLGIIGTFKTGLFLVLIISSIISFSVVLALYLEKRKKEMVND